MIPFKVFFFQSISSHSEQILTNLTLVFSTIIFFACIMKFVSMVPSLNMNILGYKLCFFVKRLGLGPGTWDLGLGTWDT